MKSIEVGVRSIKAKWTKSMIDEIREYQNIDAEKELERILKNEIRRNNRKKSIKNIFPN